MNHFRVPPFKIDICEIPPFKAYKTRTEYHRVKPSLAYDIAARELSKDV